MSTDINRDGGLGVGATLAVASVASVQFGAALAASLFDRVGPIGTVSLRMAGAAIALLCVTRPWRRRWVRAELASSALFGAVFTAMNVFLYLALARLPLATVITLEFLGPLTVAIVTAASWSIRGWAVPAALGVVLLGGALHGDELPGVLFALLAACCWAGYILLSGRIGRTGTGLAGLCLATVLGAVVMIPVGAVTAGAALLRPGTAAIGLAVGVLSSAIPYSFDLLALRRLPTAMFGVLTSLNPAVAALAGLLVLGQALSLRELCGVASIVVASGGVSFLSARRRTRVARPDPALLRQVAIPGR